MQFLDPIISALNHDVCILITSSWWYPVLHVPWQNVLSQWRTPILQHPYFLPNPFSQARAWGRPLPEADWLFAQPVSSHPLCTSLHSATCSEQNKRKIERGKKKKKVFLISINSWKLSAILKQFYVFQDSEELEIQKQRLNSNVLAWLFICVDERRHEV